MLSLKRNQAPADDREAAIRGKLEAERQRLREAKSELGDLRGTADADVVDAIARGDALTIESQQEKADAIQDLETEIAHLERGIALQEQALQKLRQPAAAAKCSVHFKRLASVAKRYGAEYDRLRSAIADARASLDRLGDLHREHGRALDEAKQDLFDSGAVQTLGKRTAREVDHPYFLQSLPEEARLVPDYNRLHTALREKSLTGPGQWRPDKSK